MVESGIGDHHLWLTERSITPHMFYGNQDRQNQESGEKNSTTKLNVFLSENLFNGK